MKFIGYHGTSKEASLSIQADKKFNLSGKKEWLGEGIYFFNDKQGDSTTDGYKEAVAWARYVREKNTIVVLECKIEVNNG